MGIKHLWAILTPFGERKPLYDLQGKTVAIDLSCWICEAQNVTEYYVQPKMYLRNLYFRTCYLLLMNVNPVFVLEGKAPLMKYDTIAARNDLQFKGAKPKTDGLKKGGKDRSRFNFVLQRCEEMLKFMGLTCVTGKGEAEALCASLNANKLVDGCISQDSDCFAYGAKVVYRNFSISQQGAHAASGGAIDVYDIQKAIDCIKFGRNKIVALAVLCGSDYSDGVFGIGKEAAFKLFETVSEDGILARLRSWKDDCNIYDEMYTKLNDKNICTSCGHFGKIGAHNKTGCKECKTSNGCDVTLYKEKRVQIKNEIAMRSKALADSKFPNEQLISEFLDHRENISKLDLRWRRPDIINFVKFTSKHLQWEPIYAFEKFLPILTRWQLRHFEFIDIEYPVGILVPDRIKKVRNPKGVASFEIIWSDPQEYYKDPIPIEELTEKLWSTIEPQDVVRKAYPKLVDAFEQSKIKKKPSKRKLKKSIEEIENLLENTSISEPKPKKKPVKSKTIDSYFKKAVVNNTRTLQDSFNLDRSKFGDEDDLDLSDIVQDIVNRTPPKYIKENLDKLQLPEETSFFITNTFEENDLFERSMHYEAVSDLSDDSASDEEKNMLNEEDSFIEKYVPLLTRLKRNL